MMTSSSMRQPLRASRSRPPPLEKGRGGVGIATPFRPLRVRPPPFRGRCSEPAAMQLPSSPPNEFAISISAPMLCPSQFHGGNSPSSARAVHLAAGRHDGVVGVHLADHLPAPAGVFLVERLVLADRAEVGNVDRLEELMVVGPHEALAAAVHLDLHALELGGDLSGSAEFASWIALTSMFISLTTRG